MDHESATLIVVVELGDIHIVLVIQACRIKELGSHNQDFRTRPKKQGKKGVTRSQSLPRPTWERAVHEAMKIKTMLQ